MISLSTLCYIEKDGKYLMLHRIKKKNDVNKDKVNDLNIWEGDKIFFTLLNQGGPFFSLKLVYDGGDKLVEVALNGKRLSKEEWRKML